MKTAAFDRAVALLEGRDVLVSYSGGKESTILLDLATRVAKRVEIFTMEVCPGLHVFDRRIAWAEQTYGLRCRRYPHWLRFRFAREGVFRFCANGEYECDINEIYLLARHEAGIQYVVTGAKKADSIWRARTGAVKFGKDPNRLAAPLWTWSSRDVPAYYAARKLALPESDGRSASGIDLTAECVCWLYDRHREDYETLRKAYPFIGAIILRRERFGIGPRYDDSALALARAGGGAPARGRPHGAGHRATHAPQGPSV